MQSDYSKHYSKEFYDDHASGMYNSAEIILDQIYRIFKPVSVIDIGCGQGAWLSAAESFGAKILKGYDGDWVNTDSLRSKNIDFVPVNLDLELPGLSKKYDLCISLEVAEHLAEANAEKFIELLCQASDTVLFGAAIKHQGGANHVNEQWQSHWISLFESRGYQCVDCIRGEIWHNESVEWWYKQNTFLFIRDTEAGLKARDLRPLEKPIFDVVHPQNYENKIKKYESKIKQYENELNNPDFRGCVESVRRWFGNRLRKIARLEK